MTDKRLSSFAILHVHEHKGVDIDDVTTEFAPVWRADVSPIATNKPLHNVTVLPFFFLFHNIVASVTENSKPVGGR